MSKPAKMQTCSSSQEGKDRRQDENSAAIGQAGRGRWGVTGGWSCRKYRFKRFAVLKDLETLREESHVYF